MVVHLLLINPYSIDIFYLFINQKLGLLTDGIA